MLSATFATTDCAAGGRLPVTASVPPVAARAIDPARILPIRLVVIKLNILRLLVMRRRVGVGSEDAEAGTLRRACSTAAAI